MDCVTSREHLLAPRLFMILQSGVRGGIDSHDLLLSLVGMYKKRGSPAVLPSPGSLSLPRRTRAFLAPRPFSAVAATTAAMFRSHPLSLRSPPGIVVCVRSLPRSFRPAYRPETTTPRSLRGDLGELLFPGDPGGAHARLFPSCWRRSQAGRSLDSPRHVPAPSPNSDL